MSCKVEFSIWPWYRFFQERLNNFCFSGCAARIAKINKSRSTWTQWNTKVIAGGLITMCGQRSDNGEAGPHGSPTRRQAAPFVTEEFRQGRQSNGLSMLLV
jgi:hypothetical protein